MRDAGLKKLTMASDAMAISSIQLFFLRKAVMQSHIDVTSFRMQFEKIGRGLLPEFFFGVRGSALLAERKRGNKKGLVPENGGEHWTTLNKKVLN